MTLTIHSLISSAKNALLGVIPNKEGGLGFLILFFSEIFRDHFCALKTPRNALKMGVISVHFLGRSLI